MSTIQRYVNPAVLGGFLAGDADRARFYGSERSLAVSTHEISIGTTGGKRWDYSNKVA
jgi:hypothetical protein